MTKLKIPTKLYLVSKQQNFNPKNICASTVITFKILQINTGFSSSMLISFLNQTNSTELFLYEGNI